MKTSISALILLISLSLGLFLVACQPATDVEPPDQPAAQPNIVLILVDDMGYTDIGAFGSEVETPNLDALAFAGVRLTNFHSSPQCAPTRSMLLSGSDNHKAGMGSMFGDRMIVGEYGDQVGYEQQLHPRVATLPERLGDAGYHTYMSGKWHLGAAPDQVPVKRGFDRSFALMTGSSSHFGSPTVNPATAFRADGELLEKLPDGFYSSTTYTDKMIDFIDSNHGDGKPFFGYLALTAPHWPLQVPAEYLDIYKGKYDAGYDVLREKRIKRAEELGVVPKVDPGLFEAVGISWDEQREDEQRYQARKMELYAAMMDNMDDNFGRIVNYLKEIGEFDNTYFFFMSDNGAEADREDRNPTFAGQIERSGYVDNKYENLGNPTSWVNLGPGFAQATTAPFRLFKGFPTEGGHRVTSFAYHPTLASGGIIDDQYLSLIDVMPTFLDIADAEFDETKVRGREVVPMDGRSFAASLGDSDSPVYGPDDVIAYELHGQRYLLRGDWKILWEQRPINIHWDDEYPDRWNVWQLYNLADDPTEQTDLAAAEPELTAELVALWEQWADEHNVIKSIEAQWPPLGPPPRAAAD